MYKASQARASGGSPSSIVSLVYPSMFQNALSLDCWYKCCFNAGTMLLLHHSLIPRVPAGLALHVLAHHGNHEVELREEVSTTPFRERHPRIIDRVRRHTSPIASTNANPKIAYENSCPRIDGLRATADRSAANTRPIPIPAPPSPMAALPMPMFWETWTMALAISDE